MQPMQKVLSNYHAVIAAMRTIDPTTIIRLSERHAYDITSVKKGGVLKLDGVTYLVTAVATYTETDEKFKQDKDCVVTELTLLSLATGETRYVEWERDDVVEISLTTAKLKARDLRQRLKYDNGEELDVDDMDEVVEEEETVVWKNVSYFYDDDWAARYESPEGKQYFAYFYEFEADDGTMLTVEAWSETGDEDGDWEYEVYTSISVDSSNIEIISLGA